MCRQWRVHPLEETTFDNIDNISKRCYRTRNRPVLFYMHSVVEKGAAGNNKAFHQLTSHCKWGGMFRIWIFLLLWTKNNNPQGRDHVSEGKKAEIIFFLHNTLANQPQNSSLHQMVPREKGENPNWCMGSIWPIFQKISTGRKLLRAGTRCMFSLHTSCFVIHIRLHLSSTEAKFWIAAAQCCHFCDRRCEIRWQLRVDQST